MSVSEVHGYTVGHNVDGTRFDCDMYGCHRSIAIFSDGYVCDEHGDDVGRLANSFDDENDRFDHGATLYGWDRGASWSPSGRYYCPQHGARYQDLLKSERRSVTWNPFNAAEETI